MKATPSITSIKRVSLHMTISLFSRFLKVVGFILNLLVMAGPERFELPTAGFEDQNSSTELRTDVPEMPLTRDGTIIDDLTGGRLHLPR